MKIQSLVCTVMVALLVFAGDALAIGPGNGLGGGQGSGQGGGGGGGDAVVTPDYGDLIILYRDDYGVPIPSPEVLVEDPETLLMVPGGQCWQPIAFNVEDTLACPAECVVPSVPAGEAVVLVNQYSCGIDVGCSGCTQEVDFGRMNNARAPASVFESQLDDVVVNLATADCVSLDPAGRLVTSRVETVEVELDEYVDVVTSGAIDSPLQNLAIYKQLMMYGYLGDENFPIVLPASALDTAARGLGAASDKGGEVNVDKVAYLNSLMGLDDVPTILDPKLCETYRKEVQGVIQEVEKCFLDYSSHGYARQTNFSALPNPGYVAPRFGQESQIGWFEFLAPLDVSTPYYETFKVGRDRILNRVFGSDLGFQDGNIGGFAQAADDARAVINYMHSWPLPADYATPLVSTADCSASPDTDFDVSISEKSGLQVPKNIVDGSSDRELIVNVANAGPDAATVTLTVTAEQPVDDGIVMVNLDGDDPDAGFIQSPFVFPSVIIAAGGSHSFSAFISVDIGEQTTINWEAIADAPGDVITSNNTRTAISTVRATSGRGGGEE